MDTLLRIPLRGGSDTCQESYLTGPSNAEELPFLEWWNLPPGGGAGGVGDDGPVSVRVGVRGRLLCSP